jgi:acyl-CoA synthetase (AMP-forming)/AMP-acid ligase II
MLTHAHIVAAVRRLGPALGLGPGDTVLGLAPFCHVMGFVIVLANALAHGATVLTVPRYDLASLLGLVERHRVTVLPLPPPVMADLAHDPRIDAHDLSAVELVVSGGAPLGAELQRAVAARLPEAVVGQGWGLTETAAVGTLPDRRRGTPPGSVGRVPPGCELRVVDPVSRLDAAPGEPGALWLRGPQVMAGYLGRPEATAEILDPDAWLHTGDLGRVEATGDVFVLDRLKELIKVRASGRARRARGPAHDPSRGGRRGRHPPPGPAPRRGAGGRGGPPRRTRRPRPHGLVAERVAPYKRIRAVRRVDVLPRSPSGKLLRRVLVEGERAAYAAASGAGSGSASSAGRAAPSAATASGSGASAPAGVAAPSPAIASGSGATGGSGGGTGRGSERSETANSSRAR